MGQPPDDRQPHPVARELDRQRQLAVGKRLLHRLDRDHPRRTPLQRQRIAPAVALARQRPSHQRQLGEDIRRNGAIGLAFGHHLHHELVELAGDADLGRALAWARGCDVEVLREHVDLTASKRWHAGHELVEHAAEGVDVCRRAHVQALCLLGREVGRCPDHEPLPRHATELRTAIDEREPEVHHPCAQRRLDEDVLGLEIAVDQRDGVGGDQQVGELGRELDGVAQRHRHALGHEAAEHRAAQQLHRDEHQVLVDADVVDLDCAGVVEHRRDPGLAHEAVDAAAALEDAGQQHLERDSTTEVELGRLVDATHPALAQRSLDAVAVADDRTGGQVVGAATQGTSS